jgi:putative intracellular protease/amidase
MTTIVTILTEGYADWESALLNAVARQHYGITTLFATPGGQPVTSAAGLRVTPDIAAENLDPAGFDVLVVNGGVAWSQPDAPDVSAPLRGARDAGRIVAGICDGTVALARAGLLDAVAHTSNSPENLPPTGYRGAGRYRDQPGAVTDDRVITAPGTAPVSFMTAVLEELGLRNDELDYYVGLHAAEHRATG